MKTDKLLQEYYLSFDFSNLRDETKAQYKYFLSVAMDTNVGTTRTLGSINLSDITTKNAKMCYEKWCEKGIHMANHVVSVARILINYAIHMEYCHTNPFSHVKRRTAPQRKVVWQKEDVRKFLDHAYSDFKYRSIGLIVHMAYEWCQRLGDMRVLKFSNIDFDEHVVHIEQSKRRADVHLPIEDDLYSMLVQQNDEFGFQQYVAPRPKPVKGEYIPYSIYKLPLHARVIMDNAGLPPELRLSDLRRTGTTEMVEAGVGMAQIMSVTGHSNPQSVKPNMKNTFASADYALTAREMHDISTYKCRQGE